jgi:uncharacterized protein (DUF1800 family)
VEAGRQEDGKARQPQIVRRLSSLAATCRPYPGGVRAAGSAFETCKRTGLGRRLKRGKMIRVGNIAPANRPLHALNRIAFGPRPGDLERVRALGVERYIHEQLDPESIQIPRELSDRVSAFSSLRMTPVELFMRYRAPLMKLPKDDQAARKQDRQQARTVLMDAIKARILRALYGPRQLQEVMTAFWFNHFNIFAAKGLDLIWAGGFEREAIRPHTMGRFRDLLGATVRHPAMLFYLDNWQNSAPRGGVKNARFAGINENYARELMELHTLGVNGGYTQADVIALAHILTGWGLARRDAFRPLQRRRLGAAGAVIDPDGFFFDPRRHDFDDKLFLGHRIAGTGIAEGERALDLLAAHPATAHHLGFKRAQYFVADAPPGGLVERMARRYLETDGQLREILAALFTRSEFWDERYRGRKFKRPYEYVLSAARLSGTAVSNFRPLIGWMQQMGMIPYGHETPDGYRQIEEAWLNPDGMMMRLSFAVALGSGQMPLDTPDFEEDDDGGLGGHLRRVAFADRRGVDAHRAPLDAAAMAASLGAALSPRTIAAVSEAPARLQAALILGSPEFMMR